MNKCKVVIKNAFDSLKNRWKILKQFHFIMDRATKVAIACCVLHNFCEIWNQPKLRHVMLRNRRENLHGFSAHLLPTHREGEVTKLERKRLILALYEQWLFVHPL
jgi:hypothetical protein